MQGLWQVHYQIMSITFLKKFIELNANMDTMIKNVRLEYNNFKDDYAVIKIINKCLMKS